MMRHVERGEKVVPMTDQISERLGAALAMLCLFALGAFVAVALAGCGGSGAITTRSTGTRTVTTRTVATTAPETTTTVTTAEPGTTEAAPGPPQI